MTPSSGDNLQATFNVTGVRIKIENTTVSVDDNTQENAQTNAQNAGDVAQ